jgi:hypothetical protein
MKSEVGKYTSVNQSEQNRMLLDNSIVRCQLHFATYGEWGLEIPLHVLQYYIVDTVQQYRR